MMLLLLCLLCASHFALSQWSVSSIAVPRFRLTSVSVSPLDNASTPRLGMFAGGAVGSSSMPATVGMIDAFNGAAQVSELTLSLPRYDTTAARVTSLVLFAGGATNSTSCSDVVEIYNSDTGALLNVTTRLSVPRSQLASASATGFQYAFFAGGLLCSSVSPLATEVVDIYNSNTGQWLYSRVSLSQARYALAGSGINNVVYFAGGALSGGVGVSNTVDVFSAVPAVGFTASVATLSVARAELTSTAVGPTVVFAGGVDASGQPSPVVDLFNTVSNLWNSTTLTVARYALAAATLGPLALFGGGRTSLAAVSSVVDILNFTLSGSQPSQSVATLSIARASLAATRAYPRAIFAGGIEQSGQASGAVDFYLLSGYRLISLINSLNGTTLDIPSPTLVEHGVNQSSAGTLQVTPLPGSPYPSITSVGCATLSGTLNLQLNNSSAVFVSPVLVLTSPCLVGSFDSVTLSGSAAACYRYQSQSISEGSLSILLSAVPSCSDTLSSYPSYLIPVVVTVGVVLLLGIVFGGLLWYNQLNPFTLLFNYRERSSGVPIVPSKSSTPYTRM
jgi:hypothetical protein